MQQRVTIGPLRDGERIAGAPGDRRRRHRRARRERRLARRWRARSRRPARGGRGHRGAGAVDGLGPLCTGAAQTTTGGSRRAAVRGLAAAADRDLLDAIVGALRDEHRNFSLLSSALKLFSTTDVDVTARSPRCCDDADADLRIQAALALGDAAPPARRWTPCSARSTIPTSTCGFTPSKRSAAAARRAAVDALVRSPGPATFSSPLRRSRRSSASAIPASRPRLSPLLGDERPVPAWSRTRSARSGTNTSSGPLVMRVRRTVRREHGGHCRRAGRVHRPFRSSMFAGRRPSSRFVRRTVRSAQAPDRRQPAACQRCRKQLVAGARLDCGRRSTQHWPGC